MKVTLDTNVLVSGTFWTGDSYRILDIIDKKPSFFPRPIINHSKHQPQLMLSNLYPDLNLSIIPRNNYY